jgi:hypothetical protein
VKHNSGEWIVRPDYGKENVYRLWDEDTNYHEDTSPETMDANARLMSLAPKMLALIQSAREMMPLGTQKRAEWVVKASKLVGRIESN